MSAPQSTPSPVSPPAKAESQYDFIPAPKGGDDWGAISPEIEAHTKGVVKAGPIRVQRGRHDGPNKGFGKTHIVAEHADEFKFCGFDQFVVDAVTTFSELYVQGDKMVVVFRTGKSRLQAVLEYRTKVPPPFWSVVTAFRPVPQKEMRGTLVWKK